MKLIVAMFLIVTAFIYLFIYLLFKCLNCTVFDIFIPKMSFIFLIAKN